MGGIHPTDQSGNLATPRIRVCGKRCAAGLRDVRILFRHLLPNFGSLLVLIFFITWPERSWPSPLCRFGAGVPHDIVTWGSLLQGRSTGFAGVVGAGISGLLPVPALEQPSVHAKNHRF